MSSINGGFPIAMLDCWFFCYLSIPSSVRHLQLPTTESVQHMLEYIYTGWFFDVAEFSVA